MRGTIEERFWAKVDKSGECWEWTAGTYSTGYGQFWHGSGYGAAHRISWELHFGSIPDGLFVLHTCDNRKCIRPDHLFLGTKRDNAIDAIQKGRMRAIPPGYTTYRDEWKRFGRDNANAKLTELDVVAIRDARENHTVPVAQLAKNFNVSERTIRRVIRRSLWSHVS